MAKPALSLEHSSVSTHAQSVLIQTLNILAKKNNNWLSDTLYLRDPSVPVTAISYDAYLDMKSLASVPNLLQG